MWEVDYPAEGETCLSQQDDKSCKSIYIPKCVDRNVYCTPVTVPANSSVIQLPVGGSLVRMGASVRFTCTADNWFFNYSVPSNLTSFYYSTNIKTTTLTCNPYGSVIVYCGFSAADLNVKP
jgi:hypothetical protein